MISRDLMQEVQRQKEIREESTLMRTNSSKNKWSSKQAKDISSSQIKFRTQIKYTPTDTKEP
jgi:hypothetical protein